MNKRLIGVLTGLVFALSASAVKATFITYDFGGAIISNNDGTLFPGKSVGDSYSGSFTLDTDAAKTGDFPAVGSSTYSGTTMALSIEGTSYVVNSLTVWADNSKVDEGIQLSFGPSGSSGNLSLRSSADIFADTSIPTSLDLSVFDEDASVKYFTAEKDVDAGTITSLSSVPEPTTLALLSLGLAGLGFTRRRMKA